eukprot:GHVL01021716.1.p2 GENE.GHVL01021716.1~~GHVL01021716.1.p2  ORF type:complete len:106 (-),score=3.96 GHVL01021716.1:798-1115(-)
MMTRDPLPPAVIGHNGVFHGTFIVEPGDEVGGVPVNVGCLPVAVRPDHLGLVLVHDLEQLRHRFTSHEVLCGKVVGLVLKIQGVEPFKQGVVHAEDQIGLSHSGS